MGNNTIQCHTFWNDSFVANSAELQDTNYLWITLADEVTEWQKITQSKN